MLVKAAGANAGFDIVRIAGTDAPAHAGEAAAWLNAGMHGAMGYLDRLADLRAGPLSDPRLLDGARSAIVVALSYNFPHDGRADDEETAPASGPRGTTARYSRGDDYHGVFWDKLNGLKTWIEATWTGESARGFSDSGPLREREIASRAGVGWQGRHTGLISLELGNWFLLGVLLTTVDLAPDAPVQGHCGTCTRCIAACPTAAIVAPYTLDARRCISYLTIEQRGSIDRSLRSAVGDRVFGCDDCLAVCPWNDHARSASEIRLAARSPDAGRPKLLEWLDLLADEPRFRSEFGGTPLLRPGRAGLRRNVCVALGNVGGRESVEPLGAAMIGDPAVVVREHAVWALGQIGARCPDVSHRVLKLLRADLLAESAEPVLEELRLAIQATAARASATCEVDPE